MIDIKKGAMENIYRFYEDILSKLKLSIIGYEHILKEVNDFFYLLTSYADFKDNKNIRFISYSLAKLKNASNWETELLSSDFFFHAFQEDQCLYELSFYNYLKSQKGIKFSTITSLSNLLATDLSFRVGCIDSNNKKFEYDAQNKLLSFYIPKSAVFLDVFSDSHENYKKNIDSKSVTEFFVEQDKSIFKRKSPKSDSEIEKLSKKLYKEGFNLVGIDSLEVCLINYLTNFIEENPELFVHFDDAEEKEKHIVYWVFQIVSIAFIANIYNCWVEYLPAIVGIINRESGAENAGTAPENVKTEYRNLGSFIVGYSVGYELTKDERTISKLISERVSYAIGGEYLKKILTEIEDFSLNAAISRIILSNTAHHLISHCAPYCTTDKVIKRLNFTSLTADQLNSVIKMVNLYTLYENSRNEFVAGLNNNNQPVALRFYKDIIQPLAENCLLLDTIAASEQITWGKKENGKNINDIQGISRLRFRIFYHCNLFGENKWEKGNACSKRIENNSVEICTKNCEINNSGNEIYEETYLEAPGDYREMVAYYKYFNEYNSSNIPSSIYCIHSLPYFRYYNQDSFHNGNVEYTCENDIEILVRGTQGMQSIYSILENFIRNTAKHASKSVLEDIFHLDIIIKLKKGETSDNINMELISNIPTFNNVCTESELSANENKNTPYAKILLESTKGIYPTTIQRGIADMKINGVFLKMQEITQRNLEKAIKVGYYPNKQNNKYSIAYSFVLKRPQKIAFVGDFNKPNNYTTDFETFGIRIFTDLNDELYSFKFVVFTSEFFKIRKDTILASGDGVMNEWLYRLPRRVIIFGDDVSVVENIINNFNISSKRFIITNENPLRGSNFETLKTCWQIWLKRWLGAKERIFLKVVPDEKTSTNIFDNLTDKNIFSQDSKIKLRNISFLRHENTIADDKEKKANWLNEDWFLENIEKNNKDFNVIWGNRDTVKSENSDFHYDLSETGLLKILIFEERLIESLGNKQFTYPSKSDFPFPGAGSSKQVERIKLYQRDYLDVSIAANLYIVTHFNDLQIKSVKTNRNCKFYSKNNEIEIMSEDMNNKKVAIKDFDVLIIHRTQLNNLFEKDNKNDIFNILKKNFPMIYISTGGGSITDIEDKTKFKFGLISLNQLLNHLTQSVMKHSFKTYIT
ncbi:MAG: hypothetical protein K9I71_07875 [Ignavibacteriales bacterium]|nr:hypothetical protein [Ignavibacteriales bacterium]